MITRYKWYRVRLPCTISEFFARLRVAGYNSSSNTGFLCNEEELTFRYMWPSIINAIRLDGEGNAEYQQVVTVNSQVVTVLGEQGAIFRFENPSRSMREVMNALEGGVGFGFGCEQIIITDDLVQVALEKTTARTLNSLRVSGAISKVNALARVELASKDGIKVEHVKSLGLGDFLIDSASYEVTHKGLKGQIGFSRSAACRISGPLTPFILHSLEHALQTKC
ncbi:hypothetical protein [Pseudomonas sp. KB-10]|uniref:hypothetical protein n=1 Tax=Pseudomonas sp. KB-10 TaxID=2292264 RepID=UPI001BAF560D|nr:hypothetical protein [Pseudomonas sp. KB-10]